MRSIRKLTSVTVILLATSATLFSGCKLKRELAVSFLETSETKREGIKNTENIENAENVTNTEAVKDTDKNLMGEILYLESAVSDAVDLNALTMCFLGCDETTAKADLVTPYYDYLSQHGYDATGQYLYEKEFEILNILQDGQSKSAYITYKDNKNAAGICYDIYDIPGFLYNGIGSSMEKQFPKEDLKSCTREDAIQKCEKYALACGYADADVQVYAMTKDALNRVSKENHTSTGAPDPNYNQTFSEAKKWELNSERNAALEKNDSNKVQSIEQKMSEMSVISYIPWEEKDEAYLLIYRPYINGVLVDGWGQTLVIVYVPRLEKAVLVVGNSPVRVDHMQEKKLISKELALSTAMLELGIEDTSKVKIKSVQLVYSTRAVLFEVEEPSMNPCWKVDYEYLGMPKDDEGSIWIDAVTGFVSRYIENL